MTALSMGRYVFVCCGCDGLADAMRGDTLTCSPACRVRAHRNGSAEALRRAAAQFDIPPGMLAQAMALQRLRPDLSKQVAAGTLGTEDCRQDIAAAFDAVIRQTLSLANVSGEAHAAGIESTRG